MLKRKINQAFTAALARVELAEQRIVALHFALHAVRCHGQLSGAGEGGTGMKTEAEIRARLAVVLADKRLAQPTATVDINAPLALIQLELETQRDLLRWVLGERG